MKAAVLAKSDRYGTAVQSIGSDIRALRKSRRMTLAQFAESLGRSVGFVSQIERGLSEPSINDLRNIAGIFDVPISLFFGTGFDDPVEGNHVVRADNRRKLGNAEGRLIEELLSPDLGGSFEMIRSTFAPWAELSEPQQRDTEEAGYVVGGTFEIEIGGIWHTLFQGDSFRLTGEPYRWRNRSEKSAVLIWVISPPVY